MKTPLIISPLQPAWRTISVTSRSPATEPPRSLFSMAQGSIVLAGLLAITLAADDFIFISCSPVGFDLA
jgi:hypothetical protein